MIKILPGMRILGRALDIENGDALVISDLQIGYEEKMLREGTFVPKFQFDDMMRDIQAIIGKRRFKSIIVNGDIKHEFGRISEQEWREVLRFIDKICGSCDEIIFTRGNHDLVLHPIARKRGIKVVENMTIGDVMLVHGDKLAEIPDGIRTIVIGHEHPAVGLRKNMRVEKFKCFLKGRYGKYNLVVLPSFNPLVPGTDILREKIMSPYLPNSRSGLSDMEVFVVEDRAYYFGRLRDIHAD